MSSLEVNKMVGAALLGGMVLLVSSILAKSLVVSHSGSETAMAVPQGTEGEGGTTGTTTPEPMAAPEPVSGLLAAADLAAGEAQFKKCVACHSIDKGGAAKSGPNLWGIVGAPVAQVAGFSYSDQLKAKGGTWDYETLNAWLANPKALVPGTRMGFAGLKKVGDRAALIAWMRNQSDAPPPLPEAGAAAAAAPEAPAAETAPAEPAAPEAPAPAATETAPEPTAPAEAAPAETAEQTAAVPAGGGLADLLKAADPAAGQKVAAKCKACHSFDQGGPNKVGPNLWDIVGAKTAHNPDFAYTDAIKNLGKEWTYGELDKFLSGPKDYAPGTKMAFAGIKKPEDRAALIAWLRGLSDSPKPLP